MLFLRRTKTARAVVCRDCGIALFRRMQSATLLTGWWGMISFFLNFGTLWSNYRERRELDRLGAPRPPATRATQTPRTTPLPAGRPAFLRPQALGVVGAALVLLLLFGAWGGASGSSTVATVSVGTCGIVDGVSVRYPIDCSDPSATDRIAAILPATARDADCPMEATGASLSERYGFICWAPV